MKITLKDVKTKIWELEETWNRILPIEDLEFDRIGHIRDPIHGYPKLLGADFAILNLPPMQRLRYISQLGFVGKIYSGANHTRFEHSIGVANVAERIVRELQEKHRKGHLRLNIRNDDVWLAKMSGYLHDVGHLPFSHASEQIFEVSNIKASLCSELKLEDDFAPHEILSYLMVQTDYLSRVINRVSENLKVEIDSKSVADAILGRLRESKRYISDLIHGSTDADRIDYLLRDGYYTGVPHGHVDIDLLVRSFSLIRREKSVWLGIDERGLEAVEALCASRDIMYPTVYLHHTSRIAEAMLLRGLYYAYRDNRFDITELLKLNDTQLLTKLAEAGCQNLVDQIMYRKFHKRIFVFKSRDLEYKGIPVDRLISQKDIETRKLISKFHAFFSSWQEIMKFEGEIISALKSQNLQEGMILIDAPERLLSEPRTEADLEFEEYLPVKLSGGEIEPVWKLSPIIKGIETMSKNLRPSAIVAIDRSIKGEKMKQVRKMFEKKFAERFHFNLRPTAVFRRNA